MGSCQGAQACPWPGLPAAGQTQHAELRRLGAGILPVPLGTLEEPCFSFHLGESSGQAAPSRRAASLSANLRGHREGSLQHDYNGGARLSVKLTLQGEAVKAQQYKGAGNAA